jgi:PAS domain S-box-containing protein
VRWNEIDDLLAMFLRRKEILTINDFLSWLDEPEQEPLRKLPGIKEFADHGFCSIWRRPIIREGNVVASISLYSTKRHAFASTIGEMLERLPLQEATEMAIHYEENANLQFRFDLKKDLLSVPCDPKSIASVITSRVAEHFKWENVSLFRVDEDAGLFRLLSQEGVSPEFFLREDYEQSLNEGLLGRVYHDPDNQRFKNIGDVTSEEFKDIFKQAYGKQIHSVLCLPILVDNKVCFLFNVEDSRKNAFAPEELEALDALLQDVAMLLNRFCLHHRIEAIRQSTKDMIILTDRRGIIKEINPATSRLLGYPESELKGAQLGAYMKDKGLASFVAGAPEFENQKIVFVRNDGTELSVLLSCASLPSELGRKVFIGSDLSFYRRDEEMGILRSMYNEIALQTKTPLSLAYSWLRRLGEDKSDAVSGIARKALQQLHKMDLTFDRLMLFERHKSVIPYNEVLLDLWYVVKRIKEEMPESEAERLIVERPEKLPVVRGDIFQLSFCIESILSYLFRFAAADEKVRIALKSNDGSVAVSIRGRGPLAIGEDVQACGGPGWISRTMTEMALGKGMIESFVEMNLGTFHETKREGDGLIFRFDLPASEGG